MKKNAGTKVGIPSLEKQTAAQNVAADEIAMRDCRTECRLGLIHRDEVVRFRDVRSSGADTLLSLFNPFFLRRNHLSFSLYPGVTIVRLAILNFPLLSTGR